MLLIAEMNVAYCGNECCLLNSQTAYFRAFTKTENKNKTRIKHFLKQSIYPNLPFSAENFVVFCLIDRLIDEKNRIF